MQNAIFRGFLAAASLKPWNTAEIEVKAPGIFRGFLAAASLKLMAMAVVMEAVVMASSAVFLPRPH